MGVGRAPRLFNRQQNAVLAPVFTRAGGILGRNDKWFRSLLGNSGYAFLQAGDYYLYDDLTLSADDLCLEGQGRGATVYLMNRSVLTLSGDRIRIAGIRFVRPAGYALPTTLLTSKRGIVVSGDYCTIDECGIEGPEMGVTLSGNQNGFTSNLLKVDGPDLYLSGIGAPDFYTSILVSGNGNAVSSNRVTTKESIGTGSFNYFGVGAVGNCIVGNVGYNAGVGIGLNWYDDASNEVSGNSTY